MSSEQARPGRRDRILQRDGHRCVYCAEPFTAAELTLDHVQPRMRGGDDSEGNLVSCCRGCNVEKGHQPAWAFLSTRPTQRRHFLDAAKAAIASDAQPVWSRHIRAIHDAAKEGVR